MREVEERLMSKVTHEDFDFTLQILELPVTRIRDFIENLANEVVTD